jgi:hypothetical protein
VISLSEITAPQNGKDRPENAPDPASPVVGLATAGPGVVDGSRVGEGVAPVGMGVGQTVVSVSASLAVTSIEG